MKVSNIVGFSLGPVISAIIGLVTVPIIAWLFKPEDIGRINIFHVALTFGLLISMFGLDQAYVREYHEVEDKDQLLLICFIPGFIFLMLLGGVSLIYSSDIADFLYLQDNPILYWLTISAVITMYITRFLSLILRMEERGWSYSLSQVVPKFLQLVLVAIVAVSYLERDFTLLLAVTFLSMIFVLVFFIWNTKKQWIEATRKKIKRELFEKVIHFGAPLIFADFAFWGLTATNTLALKSWSSLDELAVFSIATSFASLAMVFQSIFTVIWAPIAYKWAARGDNMSVVDKVTTQALAIICLIIGLAGTFSWILDFILPTRYHDVKFIFMCMLIQPLFYTLSEVTGIGIGIKRKTIFNIWISLIAMIINVILSYIMIPIYGAMGAAIANALAFTFFFILRTEVSSRIWRTSPRFKTYLIIIFILSLCIGSNFLRSLNGFYFHLIWLSFLVLIIRNYISNFKEFYEILNKNYN